MYYGATTLICVPNFLADGGPALGAQEEEQKNKQVCICRIYKIQKIDPDSI